MDESSPVSLPDARMWAATQRLADRLAASGAQRWVGIISEFLRPVFIENEELLRLGIIFGMQESAKLVEHDHKRAATLIRKRIETMRTPSSPDAAQELRAAMKADNDAKSI